MTDLAEIWVPEPQNNSTNNGTNFTRGHMGQIPGIRCLVQKIYTVAFNYENTELKRISKIHFSV